MSDFYDAIDAFMAANQNSDRQISYAQTLEIQFKSQTVRLWSGTGSMVTPDGNRWVGWFNGDLENPQSFISVPALSDPRDGSAPLHVFTLGYINEEYFNLLRNDADEADGSKIIVGSVFLEGGSTRSVTPVGSKTRLTIVGGASFVQKIQKEDDGSHKLQYSISVKAKGINAGRSGVSFSTLNATGQEFRSSVICGVEGDKYASFLASLAGGRTYTL